MNALTYDDPTFILYDFTAAFPSIARDFTLQALTAFGPPKEATQVMSNFYRNNNLHIKLHGSTYQGFTATRGIRQGCPLSPLIFAISSDSLLRVIQHQMPQTHLRTFADETAALLHSWAGQGNKNQHHHVHLQLNHRNGHQHQKQKIYHCTKSWGNEGSSSN